METGNVGFALYHETDLTSIDLGYNILLIIVTSELGEFRKIWMMDNNVLCCTLSYVVQGEISLTHLEGVTNQILHPKFCISSYKTWTLKILLYHSSFVISRQMPILVLL